MAERHTGFFELDSSEIANLSRPYQDIQPDRNEDQIRDKARTTLSALGKLRQLA